MLAMTVALLENEHAFECPQHAWNAGNVRRSATGPFQSVEDATEQAGVARIVKGEKEDSQLAMSEALKFFWDF